MLPTVLSDAASGGGGPASGSDTGVQRPAAQRPAAPVLSVQAVPFGLGVPAHCPCALHAALVMQELAASHAVPGAFRLSAQAPVVGSHADVLHGLVGTGQATGVLSQVPFWHEAIARHFSPAAHAVPFSRLAAAQLPVVASHRPVLHSVVSDEQSFGVPEQTPFEQVPRSEQPVTPHSPVTGTYAQSPVAGVHETVLQSFATQATGTGSFVQTPAWQVSLGVHLLPSASHVVPSVLAGFEQAPVAVSQVPTAWHWSDAVQTLAFAPVQTPAWQASVGGAGVAVVAGGAVGLGRVRARPAGRIARPRRVALVGRRADLGVRCPCRRPPGRSRWRCRRCRRCTTCRWSWPGSSTSPSRVARPRIVALIGRRADDRASPTCSRHPDRCPPACRALPSSQVAPLALAGFEHVPLAGSHVPAVWHWSAAVQTLAVPPHAPALEQTSLLVQALLSLHAVPVLMVTAHADVPLHLRVLHVSLVQVMAVPPHAPALEQTSAYVQSLLSLHAVPVFTVTEQADVPLQVLVLHWSLAQLIDEPPQTPFEEQMSPYVHALLSLHAVPVLTVTEHVDVPLQLRVLHVSLAQVIVVPPQAPVAEHTSP